MQAQEPEPENLVLVDEVPDVRARKAGARGARAARLERAEPVVLRFGVVVVFAGACAAGAGFMPGAEFAAGFCA